MQLVGQVSVGKTALLIRFVDEEFTPTFVSTVGIDFRCKYMMIGEEKVRLQIWDTAGQERFRAIVQAYYRSAVGICLVYDVTQRATFDSLRTWYNNIKEHASSEAVLVLIGNKSDCEPEERVRRHSSPVSLRT
jgi:Ras-related protein Rab-8A